MVTDILFPFYEILVNTIFGSVMLALIGLGVVIMLILMICRTSWNFIIFYMTFYTSVMLTYYIGAIGLVLAFFIALIYAIIALLRLIAGVYVNL